MFDNKQAIAAQLQGDIDLAADLASLKSDPRFVRIFEGKFIEDFAITNTMLIADYDTATRNRTVEKMMARSHFTSFLNQVQQDGELAKQNLLELKEFEEEDEELTE